MTSQPSTAAPAEPPAASSSPGRAVLADRNFRWLMAGSVITLLGDQFTLVALPWAVMRLSGDTAVLGLVMAAIGLPRALLILLGGAVVDRHSPHRVLMLSKHASTLLLATLALLAWQGLLTAPLILLLALGIGIATAFGIPSATAMLPQVMAPALLQTANGLMMALRQLSFFVGPLLAGGLIAWTGDTPAQRGPAPGLALAFALDAASFAVSALTLSRVADRWQPPQAPAASSVLATVGEGLRAFWADAALRSCLLYWSAAAMLISGPAQMAMPVLAASRPHWGASAFGALLGAHGLGALLGMLLSGARPGLRWGTLGRTILLVDLIVGLLFMPMGRVPALWQGQALLLAIGLLGGAMQVGVYTWIQQRVPRALLGRAMGVFMFIFMGLVPLSSAATGLLMRWLAPAQVFTLAGAALVALVALAWVALPMRQVDSGTAPSAAG